MNTWVKMGVIAPLILLTGVASAHVVVESSSSVAGEVANYVVRIPSHLDSTTIAVELEVPQGVEILTVAKTLGGNEMKRSATGSTIIRWTTQIPADQRGEVSFTARNPAAATELVWKAHQIYENGVTVDWVEPPGGRQTASVTRVTDRGAPKGGR